MNKDVWSVVQDLSYLTCPSCICNPMLKDIPFDRNESCESVVMRGVLTIKSLAAELEQVERERDAAVEDVAKLKRCEHCIGYEEFLKIDGNIERCNDCEERSNWQWRGVKEAEHEP